MYIYLCMYVYMYECMYIYIASFTGTVQCNAVPARPRYEKRERDGRWMARMIRMTLPTQ